MNRNARWVLLVLGFAAPATTLADEAMIEMFAQQPVMVGAQISPDGTRTAFLSSIDGRYHLVIEQFRPTVSQVVVPPGAELDFDWVRWANNDRLVLSTSFSARRYMVETTETRLFSIDSRGENLTAIIRPATRKKTGSRIGVDLPPPQIQDNVIDWLVNEPDHILVALDSDHNGLFEVRRVDITSGAYKTILGNTGGYRNWITDQSGEVRIGLDFNGDDLIVAVQDADGQWAGTTARQWSRAGFVPVLFTEDPNILYVMGPNASGMTVVRILDLTTDEFVATVFEHERFDADGIVYDWSNGLAVGVSYTEHLPTVDYFDETIRKLQASIDRALPDTTNEIVNTSSNRRQILILSYSDTNPGSYLIWDRDEKSLSHYRDIYSDLNADVLSPVEAVSYETRDGLTIPAYLTMPRNADGTKMPTVVLPHGGPRARDDKSYDYLSQFLASRGYAVLQPNFRGSSGYGKAFAEAGLSQWGGKMQDDLTDGAHWLIEQGIADPERMCIVGWSYGGYAAMMGAVKTPDLFQCAASINGVLNLRRQILDDLAYVGGSEWTRHMGLEGESSKSVSPYHQAERISVPVLIIQAEDDTRVHEEQGRGMAKRLEKLGKAVEYVEIPFGGHTMENVQARTTTLKSLDAFLAANIGKKSER